MRIAKTSLNPKLLRTVRDDGLEGVHQPLQRPLDFVIQ